MTFQLRNVIYMDLKQKMLYSLSDFKDCLLDRSTCDDTWCCNGELQVDL